MDDTSPPTAAALGISDVEYERIVRDLQRRGRGYDPEPAAPVRERNRSKRWPVVVLCLGIVLTLLSRLGGGDDKPAYAFLDTVDGHPVTYTSCHPIQVAIYPAGGPPGAEQLVRDAVTELRGATGLDIVVTGVFGGHAPNWNFKEAPVSADDPISVSWQDGAAIAELTDHIAGIGGSRAIDGRNGSKLYVAGTIALSREYFARLAADHDQGKQMAVLLHEFGHVFGLAHVGSRHELMYKSVTDLTTFGPGDLEGLRLLGQGPCV